MLYDTKLLFNFSASFWDKLFEWLEIDNFFRNILQFINHSALIRSAHNLYLTNLN